MRRTDGHGGATRLRVSAGFAAGVVGVLGLLAACGGSGHHNASASASLTPATTEVKTVAPTPRPAPTTRAVLAPAPAPVNPLTGIGAPATKPLIAVKIDDTAPGRPQVGIDQADIVYIEQAEGGLTRLLAIFGTHKTVVGYIRSVRRSDPELLLQYGKITLVASGGGGDVVPSVDRAGLTGWILDRGSAYFQRVDRYESDYINVTLDLGLVADAVHTPAPKTNGFTWSATLGQARAAGRAASISTQVGSTQVSFQWDAAVKKYVRYIDGARQVAADGNAVATPNVIVMSCTVSPDPSDVDVNGVLSQYTHSIGRGAVTVFRNGVAIAGTWSRPNLTSGTTLRDAAGHVIPLAPGGAWVVLKAAGLPLTSS